MTFKITARCANGHQESVNIEGGLGRAFADTLAGMLDGTSPMYVQSPLRTDSFIGKCVQCKAQLKCTVTEEATPVPPVDRSKRVLTDGSPVTDDHPRAASQRTAERLRGGIAMRTSGPLNEFRLVRHH